MNRTHNNGELRISDVNKIVELKGWVAKKRNLGSLVFIDLRDRYGITQIVLSESMEALAKDIKNEYVIHVVGKVIERSSKNPNMPTGEIEIEASQIDIINTANVTPIYTTDDTDASEDARMQYRYLDLRRPVMQNKLIMRHKITRSIREFLDNHDFIDIETPYLNRSTPEGARDFLVPSRVHNGSFYALPQSPQLFKQLLMVSGFERYYQIARCFRDEDLRLDRQPEFTQVDLETSFLSEQEIQEITERLIACVMKEVKGIELQLPLPQISYDTAMNNYGSDKPDTRFEMTLQDLTDLVKNIDFKVFSQAPAVKAIVAKNAANSYSRKAIDKLTDIVKPFGAKGLAWVKYNDGKIGGPIAKFLTTIEDELIERLQLEANDLVFFVADDLEIANGSLGALRNHLAKELNLIDHSKFNFLWVVDWPMFEWSEEENRYTSAHHPFTLPQEDTVAELEGDLSKVRAVAYDIVLNGYELGGGSLRINQRETQERMFKALGFTKESAQKQFGFLLEAMDYGFPPHGGLALGLDRFVMLLAGKENIREVIAFPKNNKASDPMTQAPSLVSDKQLDELYLQVNKNAVKNNEQE